MTSSALRPEGACIAVFAKAPVPGAVKTRLAPLLGAERAAALHAALARRALATAIESRLGVVQLWCEPDPRHEFFQRCARELGVALRTQEGPDLGARMNAAAKTALATHATVLIIGSDCPALTPAHLREAHAALAAHDAVVIPAEDGGYVLVALAKPIDAMFAGVAWGSAAVMAETRARLRASGARWEELPALWDVDRADDYIRLQSAGLFVELPS